jgi:hypothetical protein
MPIFAEAPLAPSPILVPMPHAILSVVLENVLQHLIVSAGIELHDGDLARLGSPSIGVGGYCQPLLRFCNAVPVGTVQNRCARVDDSAAHQLQIRLGLILSDGLPDAVYYAS